jgi:hypothetical protein
MHLPQFRLRSLFILTAIVAVGCLVGPPAWHHVEPRGRQTRRLPGGTIERTYFWDNGIGVSFEPAASATFSRRWPPVWIEAGVESLVQ